MQSEENTKDSGPTGMPHTEKLPVSVLIGCHNEAHLLKACLSSVSWCDEILVVDLESADHPERVASAFGRVVRHKKVDRIEDIFPEYIPALKHEWVMLIDPDEVLDPTLRQELQQLLAVVPDDVARINVPIQYYFRNRPLRGTVWGGKRIGRLMIHRERVSVGDTVHTAIAAREGYRTHKIRPAGNNVDHHYWMTDWKQLISKHRRYLEGEGLSMYQAGHRYRFAAKWKATIAAFRESFLTMRGYLDGFTGLLLSVFWAWYVHSKWSALRSYEKKHT